MNREKADFNVNVSVLLACVFGDADDVLFFLLLLIFGQAGEGFCSTRGLK